MSRTGMSPPREHRRGFTFLELVVVTSIIALLAAFAVPSFQPAFHRMQLTTCAQEMAALSRFAHAQAIVEQVPIQLRIDPGLKAAWLMRQTVTSADEAGWVPHHPHRRVSIPATVELPGGFTAITFSPDGRAYPMDREAVSVTVELRGPGGERRHLIFQGPSGRVQITEPKA